MGRRRATVEFLEKLVEFAGGRSAFCRVTQIQRPNLTAYLNATKSISWRRLKSAAGQVFGEPPAFGPITEGHDLRQNSRLAEGLPPEEGVYGLFDSTSRLSYYGNTSNLRAVVPMTVQRKEYAVDRW